jgi:glycosyltransferase involved in cell wall biosynthesis
MSSTTSRPQLLFLCQTLPYPPDGGVWIRTYHVLRLLARAFDVTALCFERSATSGSRAGADAAAGVEALSEWAGVEVFPIPQRHSRIRYGWDHTRSIVRGRAYTEYLYESRAFRRRIEELLQSHRFDLVHADSLDMAGYFSRCSGIPVVCVHHDVESALLDRRAAIERTQWRSAYLRYQARLTARLERRWCGRVALNVTVSEQDRALLLRAVPGVRAAVVPNGVDTDEFRPGRVSGEGVAYVGGTHWFPNLDALEFFAGNIRPHLGQTPRTAMRWIGHATPEQQRHYRERYDIELTGYVGDVRPFMREAACHIVPLRAGGGTRLKILNSWAMGKPVVSTSIGCEGLAAVDGDNILIRDDPREFAKAVACVLQDAVLRRRLGERGRETAERLYAWDVIGEAMIETYRSTCRTVSPRAASQLPERLTCPPAPVIQ